MVKLHIFISPSGLPMDFKLITELSVPEESTLKKLREILYDNPEINPNKLEFMRVRELTKTMWPGKVYKEDNKSIKKLSISFGATLIVEFLENPDVISYSGVYIYIGQRNVAKKINENIISCYFDAGVSPNIDHLYDFAIKKMNKEWKISDVTLGKFKSHNFEWEIIKDARSPEERGQLLNAKSSNTAQGIYNLKKQPYLLKDGDLISIRYDKDEGALEDNFVCESDALCRQEYQKRKNSAKKSQKPARPEKSIKIGDF